MEAEKDILKKHITSDFKKEVPSVDFTQLVMKKVEASLATKPVFEPLISKKIWISFGCVAGLILLLSFVLDVQQADTNWFGDIGIELPNLEQFKNTITLSILMALVLGLMTVADILFRKRRQVG